MSCRLEEISQLLQVVNYMIWIIEVEALSYVYLVYMDEGEGERDILLEVLLEAE